MSTNEPFNYDPYTEEKEDVDEVDDFDDFIEKNSTGMDYYAILNVPKTVNIYNYNLYIHKYKKKKKKKKI